MEYAAVGRENTRPSKPEIPTRMGHGQRNDRPRCRTCGRIVLAPEPTAPRYASEPPSGQCVVCFVPNCDVCHTRPAVVERRLRAPLTSYQLIRGERVGGRDVLRPAYISEQADRLRLCASCDATPVPETESGRLQRQVTAQRCLVSEMRRTGTARGVR
jgi:hypothetical protein